MKVLHPDHVIILKKMYSNSDYSLHSKESQTMELAEMPFEKVISDLIAMDLIEWEDEVDNYFLTTLAIELIEHSKGQHNSSKIEHIYVPENSRKKGWSWGVFIFLFFLLIQLIRGSTSDPSTIPIDVLDDMKKNIEERLNEKP